MRHVVRIVCAAALLHLAPARAQAPQKAVASPAVQAAFDRFIATFRTALKANNSAAIARLTRLPFAYDGTLRDAAQFRAKAYPHAFPAKTRACLQTGKAIYDRDQDKNDAYFIFCSQQIFVFTKTPTGFLFTDISADD